MKYLALAVLLGACGSSSTINPFADVGTPVPGEGNLCPTGSVTSCDTNESCAAYTSYQSPDGTCRTVCDAGCEKGESCGDDGTCQCTPTLSKGAAGDACLDAGLICHPDFRVCLPPVPGDAGCQGDEIYSPAWTLCLLPG